MAKGLSLLVPVVLFLWIGERGLDFGRHWDEPLRWQSIRTAIEEETLLPETYNYPSMSFWVSAFALAPEAIDGVEIGKRKRMVFLAELAQFTETEEYHLRLRRCFLWLSALSLVWVWFLALSWRRRWGEGFVAAGVLGFSWEVGYHARWAAPDTLMMMLAALCVMLLLRALDDPRRRRWLLLAAVAAGLATGTKYNAGLLLLPVLGVSWAVGKETRVRERAVGALRMVGVFLVTFLVTTPGAVLQPLVFAQNVRYEMRHYRELGHYGFTVDGGWDHLSRNLEYLGVVLPSPLLLVSLLVTALALIGAAAVMRESRSRLLLLVALPLLYVLYISTQRVMFVRNLLFVAPFGAVLAARGFGAVWDVGRGKVSRSAVAAAVGMALLANVVWSVAAAESVRERRSDRFVKELAEYVADRPDERFFVTPQVVKLMEAARVTVPETAVTAVGGEAEYFVGLPHELRRVEVWPGLVRGEVERVFGPREVNFEYYATWPEPHVVVLEWSIARRIADVQERPWLKAVFPGLVEGGEE